MNNKLKEILKRTPEDWGEINLSQFERDIDFLKKVVQKQQQIIERQQNEIKRLKSKKSLKIELSDPNLLNFYILILDNKPLTIEELKGAIEFLRHFRKVKMKLNE